jgi:ribosomal protein L40E
MFCLKCGAENPEGSESCRVCGAALGRPAEPPKAGGRTEPRGGVQPPLAPAILATIFCCQPFGIVAIVYAAMAQAELGGGREEEAREHAEKAWFWTRLAFGIGLAWALIVVLFMAGGGTVGS